MKDLSEVEQEVKLLEVDVQGLLKKLSDIGAIKKCETTMHIISYALTGAKGSSFESEDAELSQKVNDVLFRALAYCGRYGSLRKSNAHLRLRYRDDASSAELCFKYNLNIEGGYKIAREHNVDLPVGVAGHFEKMSSSLGLEEVAVHDKNRVSYRLKENGCICDIDTYPGIPTYAEIEHDNPIVIEETIKLLGLNKLVQSTKSGQEFFKAYNVDYYSTLTF